MTFLESRAVCVELDRRLAGALAASLGLPRLDGASAGGAAGWGDEGEHGLFLCDGDPREPSREITTLAGPVPRLVDATRHAQRLDDRVGFRAHHGNPHGPGVRAPVPVLLHPSDAPAPPVLGDSVLPLRMRPGHTRAAARYTGVADLRRDDGFDVVEIHEGRVLAVTTFSERGIERASYTSAADRVAPIVSPAGRRALADAQISFDPRDVVSRESLAELLRALGIEDPSPILALEERIGGLVFGPMSRPLFLGIYRSLRPQLDRADDGGPPPGLDDGRVDCGSEGGDMRYLADERGRIHFVDDVDGTDFLMADDVQHFVERLVRQEAGLGPPEGPDLRIEAFVGARLAAALGAPPISELSDGAKRLWMSERVLVHERPAREGRIETFVVGRTVQVLSEALEALDGVTARASTRYTEVRRLLERTGLEVVRQTGERWWEDPVPEDVRALAAEVRDGLDADELQGLAGHASPVVRRAVAERTDVSAETLGRLVDATGVIDLEDLVVLDAVARHPRADAALERRLATVSPPEPMSAVVARAVAMSAKEAALLSELATHHAVEVRHGVASNPSAGAEDLERLGRDGDPRVRRAVAAHGAAPEATLRALATDSEEWVLLALASNPRTPDDALGALAESPVSSVAHQLATRPTLPADLATRVAFHPLGMSRNAACPSLPLVVLADLCLSPRVAARRGVAENPSTPPELLAVLLEDDSPAIRRMALGHPALPRDLVPTAMRGDVEAARAAHPIATGPWVGPAPLGADASLGLVAVDRQSRSRGSWASHPTFPKALLAELLEEPEYLFSLSAVCHPWVPESVLASAAAHPYLSTRATVAAHERTPVDALVALAADEDPGVRAAAAQNPRLPIEVLPRLAADGAPEVREGAALHPGCPTDLLEELACDAEDRVRSGVARNRCLAEPLLEKLAADDSAKVRLHVPLSPRCPDGIAERLRRDPDGDVEAAAIWRLLGGRPYDALRSGTR